MPTNTSTARAVSIFSWVMAAIGTLVGQIHALARAQAHPDDFDESPLARVWGEPAIRLLRPLLDWSDPWTVYVTYGKIWVPVCIAFTPPRVWSTDGDVLHEPNDGYGSWRWSGTS